MFQKENVENQEIKLLDGLFKKNELAVLENLRDHLWTFMRVM